jgi:TonB family protein
MSGFSVFGAQTLIRNGSVAVRQVKHASKPAFGESALAAARQWRFLPKVKAGKPEAVTVEMPFNFNEP